LNWLSVLLITLPTYLRCLPCLTCLRVCSNFDYLMHLNREAGRSFKDLSQYPVSGFIQGGGFIQDGEWAWQKAVQRFSAGVCMLF
jgi:hypothetical protein